MQRIRMGMASACLILNPSDHHCSALMLLCMVEIGNVTVLTSHPLSQLKIPTWWECAG